MILWQFIAWYDLWSRGGIGVSYVSISYYWSFHVFGPINLRSQIHGWGFTMGTLSIHNKQKDDLEYIEKSKWVFKMATMVAKFCTTELFRSVAINLKFLLRKAAMQKLNWRWGVQAKCLEAQNLNSWINLWGARKVWNSKVSISN